VGQPPIDSAEHQWQLQGLSRLRTALVVAASAGAAEPASMSARICARRQCAAGGDGKPT